MTELEADFENRLLEGLAGYLAAQGVAAWRTTDSYLPDETPIFIDAQPQSPDTILALSLYPVFDPLEADSLVAVQVMTRTAGEDPRPGNLLAGRVFNALHGLSEAVWAGVRVQLCWRQSSADLGRDQFRRWSRSDNYYVRTYRPAPHRM